MSITTKFDDFKDDKRKKFNKSKTYEPLSNDISALIEVDGEYQKIDGPVEIESVMDVIKDPEKISKLESALAGGVVSSGTELNNVKRGDVLWMTCMVRKSTSLSYNSPSVMSVIKMRIVDIYSGLSILKNVIK